MAASSRDIRAGGAYLEVYAKGIEATRSKLQAFAKDIGKVGTSFLRAGAAIAAPLLLSVKTYAETGDELLNMSKRTGITVEKLQELQYAAKMSDVTVEDLGTAIKKMQQAIAGGVVGGKELLNLPPEEQLAAIVDWLQKIPDEAERTAAAVKVFGRGGTAMLQFGGAAEMHTFMEEKRKMGVMSKGEAETAAALMDVYKNLTTVVKGLALVIGAALGPALRDAGAWIQRNALAAKQWLSEHQTFIVVVGKLALGFIAVGVAMKSVAAVIGVLCAAMKALVAAATLAVAHPLIAAALAGSILTVYIATEWLGIGSTKELDQQAKESLDAAARNKKIIAERTAAKEAVSIRLAADAEAAKKTRDYEAKLFEELRQLEIAQIEDEYAREMTLIEEKYNKERAEAEKLRADIGLLDAKRRAEEAAALDKKAKREEEAARSREAFEVNALREAWNVRVNMMDDDFAKEMEFIEQKYNRDREEAEKLGADTLGLQIRRNAEEDAARERKTRRDEDLLQKQMAWEGEQTRKQEEANAELDKQIAEARIEATDASPQEKELARLQLELKEALRESLFTGADAAKIEELFRLRRLAISEADAKTTTAGTFNPFAIRGLGTGSETSRIRAAAEAQLRKLDVIDLDLRNIKVLQFA